MFNDVYGVSVKVAKHAFAGAACEAQGEWLREALDTSFWGEFSRYAKKGPFSTSSGLSLAALHARKRRGRKP